MLSSKKKTSRKPRKAAQSSLAGSVAELNDRTQINLLDSAAVKRELDEAAARAAKQAGFQEDQFVSNVKIVLGLAACSTALVAQFYPKKHPDNWWLLLFCIIAYAACTAALSLFLCRFEQDAFYFTVAKKGLPSLKFISKMPRHSETYTLSITVNEDRNTQTSLLQPMPWIHALLLYIPGLQPKSEPGTSRKEEMSRTVTSYFHGDGYLDETRWSQDVQNLLKALQTKVLASTL